jgi:hypothetical protein
MMDILSPKGQLSVEDEQRAVKIFVSNFAGFIYAETPKNKPADIDAFIINNGIIVACVETKCRYDCDLHKFQTQYENKWLVTFDKLEKARSIAKSLCIKSVGFLYLKQSDVLLVQSISDQNGNYIPDINIATTATQATINGGKAIRTNAFINMNQSKILREIK